MLVLVQAADGGPPWHMPDRLAAQDAPSAAKQDAAPPDWSPAGDPPCPPALRLLRTLGQGASLQVWGGASGEKGDDFGGDLARLVSLIGRGPV